MTAESVLAAAGGVKERGRWLLRGADLSGADLRWSNLRWADLRWSNLRWADLRSANLRSVDLSDANLRGADLSGANLNSANLRSVDLSDANLRSADLSGANLNSANLRSANLSSGRITRSVGWMPLDQWSLAIWANDIGQGIASFGCQTLTFASTADLRSQTGELATDFATDPGMSAEWLTEALRIVADWKVGA